MIALKLMVNNELKCLVEVNTLNLITLKFMIYTDFESILVAEDNGKQNLEYYYTNKYQEHPKLTFS